MIALNINFNKLSQRKGTTTGQLYWPTVLDIHKSKYVFSPSNGTTHSHSNNLLAQHLNVDADAFSTSVRSPKSYTIFHQTISSDWN